MDVVIRDVYLSEEAIRMESGFYSVVMFTGCFLWSLYIFN